MLVSPLRCFKVSKFHATASLVLRVLRVLKVLRVSVAKLPLNCRGCNSYLPFGSNDYYLSRLTPQTIATYLTFGSNDCYKVSKFHASEMLVSPLRCFKVSSLTTPPHSKPRFYLFAKKNGYRKVNQDLSVCFQIGVPIANQDLSVCYGEKRRYELLSMIEQSDIIRATSLPNAQVLCLRYNLLEQGGWIDCFCYQSMQVFNLDTFL